MLVTGKGVMDWEIKLDQEDNTLFSFQVGSSYSGKQNNNGGFPMCLKLGTSDTPTMLVSPSGSLKRTRRPNGTPNVLCSVDGCKSDLRYCKSYHRRHRVCEHHSKAPVVTVGGQEQRFCQQCSRYVCMYLWQMLERSKKPVPIWCLNCYRFHSLGEFDEVKRSCRKRLDGHNRRRRKSQPASSYVNSQSFLSKQLGTRILQFSNPQVCATSTVRNPSCLVFAKGKAEAMIYNGQQQWHVVDQQSLPNSSSCICNEESKPLLPATVPKISYETVPAVYICQPLCKSTASPEKRSSNGMLSNGKTQSVDSNCAFSLPSTHPTQASGISLSHLVQSNATHPIAEFPCSHSMLNEHFGSVLIPYANQTNNDCNGMLHVGADSLSGYGAIRKLPIL